MCVRACVCAFVRGVVYIVYRYAMWLCDRAYVSFHMHICEVCESEHVCIRTCMYISLSEFVYPFPYPRVNEELINWTIIMWL